MTAPPTEPEELSPADRYRLFRSRIEHEDSLITQRFSWLVASQSFLFTAYALTTNGLSGLAGKGPGVFLQQSLLLFHLIPVVAISNALLIYLSILGGFKAIRELRRLYLAKTAPRETPPLKTSTAARALGMSGPLALPLLFVAVWLLLLIHGLKLG